MLTLNLKKSAFALAALLVSGSVASAAVAIVQTPLNVRAGKGTGYRVVGTMPPGARVDAVDCAGGWCYIPQYGGFASARYLAFRVAGGPPPGVVAGAAIAAGALVAGYPYWGGYYYPNYYYYYGRPWRPWWGPRPWYGPRPYYRGRYYGPGWRGGPYYRGGAVYRGGRVYRGGYRGGAVRGGYRGRR